MKNLLNWLIFCEINSGFLSSKFIFLKYLVATNVIIKYVMLTVRFKLGEENLS